MARKSFGKAVTQKDVAKRAGVTQATVSMVLNGSSRINDATRSRVEKAVAELGYIANRSARNLVTQRNHVLSLVAPNLSHESEHFLMPLMQGLLEGLKEEEYILSFCMNQPGESAVQTIKRALQQDQVAGMFILSPYEEETEYIDYLLKEKAPFVVVNRQHEDNRVPCVAFDNADVAYRAVTYLFEKGRNKIGFINGPENRPSSRDRLRGVRMALLEHNLKEKSSMIVSGNFQFDGGYYGMKKLLQNGRPDGLFAGSDFHAFGAIQAIQEIGLKVPEDVAIVGCDDVPMSQWIRPPLTTIRIPFYEMGNMSAHLLSRLARSEDIPTRQIILPCHFIERESV